MCKFQHAKLSEYAESYTVISMIAVRQLHRHQFSVILDRFPSLRFTEKEALKGLPHEIFRTSFVLMAVLYIQCEHIKAEIRKLF